MTTTTEDQVIFETAAEHLARAVPVASATDTVGAIREGLGGRRFETAAAVAVCDEGRLVGLVRIEDLLAAPEGASVAEVMDGEPPVVGPGMHQERAAWQAVQHGESTIAVVDEQRMFLGLIPPSRMLQVLLWEHEEDLARLGGFVHDAEKAREASEEAVARRYWHRLPWLLLGLAGALVSAVLIGAYEQELEANVLLALFIPGIVYMADAVGTQTETLIIRGLSVGVKVRQVVKRELLTGALVGVTVAAAFYPLALWRWSDFDVAVTAALALLAACSTATVVAMALPYLLDRLGKDPAYGSGPLATVIQDLISILVYFAIASAIMG
ncbi:MAG TPA: magnesium transporter [Acidimicrobiia bacterium]|nr:magnesium transporter [Acidimicrobiia bacterium]